MEGVGAASSTGMDHLVADIIDLLKTAGLRFPVSLCGSEGMYIMLSIARMLWMVDGDHDTSANAADRNSDIPAFPSTWMSFNDYNDYRAKKVKRPQLSAKDMHTVAQLLFGMLGKPVLRRPAWNSFTKDVESLAIVMESTVHT